MRLIAAFATLFATNAAAAPNVVTDIAPIHGLVSDVMGDLGAPTLLLPANADAHSYTMRPSDGQTLADAEIVIWVGAGLTPWLEKPLETLVPDATKLALLLTEGWTPRELHDADDHDHGVIDPHAWLDPAVAATWLVTIAQALGAADPENADTYAENAAQAAAQFAQLREGITAQMAPFAGRAVIWPHDAYGYFADAFGVTSAGAIMTSDAAPPSIFHMTELGELARSGEVICILSDPEVKAALVTTIRGGTGLNTAQIDPIGTNIPLGVGFYSALISQLADQIAGCLAP